MSDRKSDEESGGPSPTVEDELPSMEDRKLFLVSLLEKKRKKNYKDVAASYA